MVQAVAEAAVVAEVAAVGACNIETLCCYNWKIYYNKTVNINQSNVSEI